MPRIIESVLVYDDGPDKSTELDQRMPVATVAGQPRCLDRKYGADPPLTDGSQQALEARPIDAASRAAQIIVDDLDHGPAELTSTIGEPVLTAAALRIVQELICRRLADVNEGAAARWSAVIFVIADLPVCQRRRDLEQQGFDQRCQLFLL